MPNNNSWNLHYHLLVIDQPIGTGLSLSFEDDTVSTTQEASQDFLTFLNRFFELFPELLAYPFIITGESYAGHYIPIFALDIMEKMPQVNLKGVAIGDGWVNSFLQTGEMPSFLFSVGVVDINTLDLLNTEALKSQTTYLEGLFSESTQWSMAVYSEAGEVAGNMDIDNYQLYMTPELIASEAHFEELLLTTEIGQDYFGMAHYDSFEICNSTINDYFLADEAYDFTPYYSELFQTDLPCLLYYGQNDMNCGAWGAQVWLKEVDWAPIEDLLDQSSVPWFSHDEIAGRIKSQDNVIYAIVYGAGHMVPVDQPERAYDLISEFVDSL